jgi:hypothetical protein
VKLTHTAVWAVFVACILALPYAGWIRRFDLALLLTILILIECVVLALNHGQCPLTTLASRYTTDRSSAFDIYLPEWLAERNKQIFGTLFVMNELVVLWFWQR